ncbi:MAG: hypothetical protein K6F76_03910 [Clostridiales bacterium]|nr:hypothetical protein [Clostridiales bacterium]
MEDISKKISEILSDPEAMEQIKGLAGMLGNDQSEQQSDNEGISDFSGMPDGAEMLTMAMKIMPLLKQIKEEDNTTMFLKNLRPLLSSERQIKLDEALKIQQLMKLVPLLGQIFGNN